MSFPIDFVDLPDKVHLLQLHSRRLALYIYERRGYGTLKERVHSEVEVTQLQAKGCFYSLCL